MPTNELKKAKVKSTGKEVEVYKSFLRSTWIDYADCKTEYSDSELQFTDPKS